MEREGSEYRKSYKTLFEERCTEYMHSCYLSWQQIYKNIMASIDLSGRLNFFVDRQPGLAGFFHVLRPAPAGFFHVPTETQQLNGTNPINDDRVNCCTQGEASMLMKPNTFDYESKPIKEIQEYLTLKRKADKITQNAAQKKKLENACFAEMFLAGPLAWPDYPEYDEIEIDEGWLPLDWKKDSNSGE